jgi:hypothetical protein
VTTVISLNQRNLFSEPSDIKKFHLHEKKMSLLLFYPPLHNLPCKFGAPRQAKHEKINVFRPVSEQIFIPEINFYFVLRSNILAYPFC